MRWSWLSRASSSAKCAAGSSDGQTQFHGVVVLRLQAMVAAAPSRPTACGCPIAGPAGFEPRRSVRYRDAGARQHPRRRHRVGLDGLRLSYESILDKGGRCQRKAAPMCRAGARPARLTQGFKPAQASRRGFARGLPPFSLARAAISSWCWSR